MRKERFVIRTGPSNVTATVAAQYRCIYCTYTVVTESVKNHISNISKTTTAMNMVQMT